MKILTNILVLMFAIFILLSSLYVTKKHQKGYYKQEIPKKLLSEVYGEYKKIWIVKSFKDATYKISKS